VVTGIMVLHEKSVARDNCTPKCADQAGRDAVSTGKTLIPINFVAWGVGAGGLAVGSILFFTSKTTTTPSRSVRFLPLAGPGLGGVALDARL
jgi:hypothetical protein